MRSILSFLFVITATLLLSTGCISTSTESLSTERIAQELIAMRDSDQKYEFLVVNKDPQASEPDFFKRKAQAQAINAKRCKEIFNDIGYPAYSLVGEQASKAFWLLVQHADDDPVFQEQVAIAMKPMVIKADASPRHLAMLTDRVRINTNRSQVFGSQVKNDMQTCRAMPKSLENPHDVDQRRSEVGLIPLWQYMNEMSELSFMMNTQYFQELGVTHPWVYPKGFSDW